MTDQEFEMVALAIKAAYPNSNVLPDKYAMKVWYRALGDLYFRRVLRRFGKSVQPDYLQW